MADRHDSSSPTPPAPPERHPIRPMVPEPEIYPQRSPDVNPQRITSPEIQPPDPSFPEIFPQHSPDATPPFEDPGVPDVQPPNEIPPVHDRSS